MAAEIDARLLAEIAARRVVARRGHLLAARAGALRGRLGDDRPRGPRPADDAAARRPRDDRDRAGLDARPADPPPGRDGPDARRRRAVRARRGRRVAAAAPGRPARRPAARGRRSSATACACPRAPTSRRRSGSPTPARTPTRTRTRSAPSASSTARPRPTRGSRTAAACGAASARRSPRWRCGSCSRAILERFDLRAASRRAERVARRNVTFSPRGGTRVIATPRA